MADHAVQIHIYPEPHSTGRTERLLGLSRAYALSLGQNPASITSPLRSQEGKPYFPPRPLAAFFHHPQRRLLAMRPWNNSVGLRSATASGLR